MNIICDISPRNQEKKEPAWVRRMSLQEARKEILTQEQEVDTRRKGSTWVGKEEIPEEEESEGEQETDSKKNVKDEKKIVVKDDKPVILSRKPEAPKEISTVAKNISSIVKNISQPVEPGAVKLSTTTIIVSKEEDDSSKLKAEKMKESGNLESKDSKDDEKSVNPRTTRQRRQGRLELELGQEDHSIRSCQDISSKILSLSVIFIYCFVISKVLNLISFISIFFHERL